MHQWKPGHFEAAMPYGRIDIHGLVYRGLGLECVSDDGGGVWFDDWDLTHLASGYRIGTITGLDEGEAFKLATMVADLADWNAIAHPDQVAEIAPDLMARLLMLSDLAGGAFVVTGLHTVAAGSMVNTAPESSIQTN